MEHKDWKILVVLSNHTHYATKQTIRMLMEVELRQPEKMKKWKIKTKQKKSWERKLFA